MILSNLRFLQTLASSHPFLTQARETNTTTARRTWKPSRELPHVPPETKPAAVSSPAPDHLGPALPIFWISQFLPSRNLCFCRFLSFLHLTSFYISHQCSDSLERPCHFPRLVHTSFLLPCATKCLSAS